ncbi:MAG TPA: GNAT family N-acetyltransferase [Gammaproteobacteria bacterium]|nr:GNAT family N-acetyltransferase [Gammaproteobacteria bacterium]
MAAENTERAPAADFTFRDEVRNSDPAAIRRIIAGTGFFNETELEIAMELVVERLQKGASSGYEFCFAEAGSTLAGYACFGPIAGTVASFDLYWIAVAPGFQGRGLGKALLARAERAIAAAGGRRVYIETSSRAQYRDTRAFYGRCGYRLEAVLADFYAPADDKLIFVRQLGALA